MIYPVLEQELKKRGMNKKFVAAILGAREQTVRNKMSGFIQWKLNECLKIKAFLGYTDTIETLFSKKAA